MPITLTSSYLQFTCNPETAKWSLHGIKGNSPFIEDAWMQISYRHKNKICDALQNWRGLEIHGPHQIDSLHGTLQQITLVLGPDQNGLIYKIEFALTKSKPLFLWRLIVENHGTLPVEIDRVLMFQAGCMPSHKRLPSLGYNFKRDQKDYSNYGVIRPYPDPGELAFFSNGWQSWSFSGSYGNNERSYYTRLGFFTKTMWFNEGTPKPRQPGHFSSDMFGVLGDRKHRSGIVAGFLSQKKHFGSLEASTDPLYPAMALWANGDQTRLEPGDLMDTDWAVIQFVDINSPDPLSTYLDAVSIEHNLHLSFDTHNPSIGWCSWYQYFQDITEIKIRGNLLSANDSKTDIPFDLFQIDDGFQAQIGDWLAFSPNFPNGVRSLSEEIQESGYTPGLWLAPFIVHSKSQLKRHHSDWLLRNAFGKPVNAGFVWNNINNALDLTNPEAIDYVKDVVSTATTQWGYQFLKLDFLYAAAIKGHYKNPRKTRAQVLRLGLEALREAAGPETHLLGCGVPLGPSIGIFDSVRIGPDVGPNWEPSLYGVKFPFHNEKPMPSTRSAIHNTLTRAPLQNRWWINDPDCLLVRPDTNLTLPEVQSLATVIALTGGPLILSDDLPQLPSERLNIIKQLVPLINQRAQVPDWFDKSSPRLLQLDLKNVIGNWSILAVFNWDDEEQDLSFPLDKFSLPNLPFLAREFWSGSTTQITLGSRNFIKIPAHGVRVFALRSYQPTQICYLGGDLHISQGLEVTEWSGKYPNIRFRLEKPGKIKGYIDLYIPSPPSTVKVNQENISWENINKNIYRLPVQFEGMAEVEINQFDPKFIT